MPFHLYKAVNPGESPLWFGIHIEFEDDRWMATCLRVDPNGQPLPGAPPVAPKFYGVTPEQAQRRMYDILENTYDEVIHVELESNS